MVESKANRTPKRTEEEVKKLLKRYLGYKQHPVTLRQLLEIGSSDQLEAYKFLRGQIPTRLSHAILELESIPGPLLEQPSVREISQKYRQSFLDLLTLPAAKEITKLSVKRKKQTLTDFSEILSAILHRHANVVATMGMGIQELKQQVTEKNEELYYLKEFLDRFYMSRIGLRTHMEQYLNIFADAPVHNDKWVGIFSVHCDIKKIIEEAAEYTADLCRQNYCDAPPVEIHSALSDDEDAKIVYCPSHLNYIMTELLKNSMRAVVEFHGEDKLEYPPIVVNICAHERELVIKISDQGGGISQSNQLKLFSYFYSTAHSPDLAQLRIDDSHFAGFGYGLALARLHARYMSGDLTICPMYGYGTDVYIYIPNIDHASEVLPRLDLANLKRTSTNAGRVPNPNWMESQRLSARNFPQV